MSISYPPNAALGVGPDVPITTIAAPINVIIAVANSSRAPEGLIINNANKNMWVTFTGTAATTASPSIMIPANGGSVDIPGGYTGVINAIWVAGATGSAIVHEFSYV
jgi:hypothetical protein